MVVYMLRSQLPRLLEIFHDTVGKNKKGKKTLPVEMEIQVPCHK